MALCPNCEAAVELTADECPRCGALFGVGSAWKPLVTYPQRSAFRNFFRLVFYVYLYSTILMGILVLAGGGWHWYAAFIGLVIGSPWWWQLGPIRIDAFWIFGAGAALNLLILGLLAFRGKRRDIPNEVPSKGANGAL